MKKKNTSSFKNGVSLPKYALALSLLALSLFTACSHDEAFIRSKPDKSFALWTSSDIQPKNIAQRESWENAVQDVSENFPKLDAAIAAGDIVQKAKNSNTDADWQWFMESRKKAGASYWFEIAGNHDARDLAQYLEHTGKPLHYAVKTGNVLMVFMSDTNPTSGTDIPDDVFLWWKKLIEENRDRIIITVTHSNPADAGFIYALIKYRNLQGSERFEKVLEKEKTDLWLFGHTHNHPLIGRLENASDKYQVLFINTSAIREDYSFSHSWSRLILFKDGSDTAVIKLRDHRKKLFIGSREVQYKLKTAFKWSADAPVILPYPGTK